MVRVYDLNSYKYKRTVESKSLKIADYKACSNKNQSCGSCTHCGKSNTPGKAWCNYHANYCETNSVCNRWRSLAQDPTELTLFA